LHVNAPFSDTAVKLRLALMKTPLGSKNLGPNQSIWEPVTAKKCDNLFTSTPIEPRQEHRHFATQRGI